MKHILTLLIALLLASCASGFSSDAIAQNFRLPETDNHYKRTCDYVEAVPDADYQHASPAAMERFRDLKYGIRIHWGAYTLAGYEDTSWPFLGASYQEKQAYQERYKTWNPTGFDAEQWMRFFKTNGMRMFAFTANHHDGFSMFDTKAHVKRRVNWTAPGGPQLEDCDLAYSIMETPFHRDVVRELCEAGRKYGLKIDLYYSHPNWYDADFRPYCYHPVRTPDIQAHPELYANSDVYKKGKKVRDLMEAPDPTPEEQARMMARHRQQLTELLSNYGPIDMVCLDMWFGKKNWPELRETIKSLRKIQPDVMLRARGIGNYGDYYTPEGFVPGSKENTDMPWFVIYPLATSFAFSPDAAKYKGSRWIVTQLVDAVAKGGNFMVAIGPDKDGVFHPTAIEQITQAGQWINANAECIYETRPRPGDEWHEGKSIRFTRSKDSKTIYAISLEPPGSQLVLTSVTPKAGSVITFLGRNEPLKWKCSAGQGLVIEMPADLPAPDSGPASYAWAFKIQVD